MAEEPNLAGEPTSLDERLRREEPPISDEDTYPSQSMAPLDERLRREEPPISDEDTNPSPATRAWQAGGLRPTSRRAQRLSALIMLLGALILTAAAGYIWLAASGDDDEKTDSPGVVQAPIGTLTGTPADAPTSAPTALPDQPTATGARPAIQSTPDAIPVFPTAAVDEIAAALLTPAPGAPADRAVARRNAPFTIRPADRRTNVIQYTVQQGDTLESIAEKFGFADYYTLIWSNKSNKYSPLRPGNQLNILPEDGVYYEVRENTPIRDVAAQYNVDPYTIIDAEYNNLFGSTPDTLLVVGMWVVIPGGEGERINFLPAAPSSGGGSGGVISGSYTLWGCTANISGGTEPYNRPLANYRWMQGFVPGGHTGVDLAPGSGSIGDPVRAAGAGTVVFAGWSDGGYGYVVVIAHSSTFSLYAHLDSARTNCNQHVNAGDTIGILGNSGNSSGPHLHFEIRDASFNARNPQDWIGF